MIGLYGPIFFHSGHTNLTTFDQMKKSVSARWGTHEIFGAKPLLEYTGPQLIEISFKMELIKPVTWDPLAAIILLEEMMDLAVPAPLVIGLKPMGRGTSMFVMTQLQHEMKYFYRGGGLMGASVEVQLKEYPDSFNLSNLIKAIGGKLGLTAPADVVAGGGTSTLPAALAGGTTGATQGVSSAVSGAVAGVTGGTGTGLISEALNVEKNAVSSVVNALKPAITQNVAPQIQGYVPPPLTIIP